MKHFVLYTLIAAVCGLAGPSGALAAEEVRTPTTGELLSLHHHHHHHHHHHRHHHHRHPHRK